VARLTEERDARFVFDRSSVLPLLIGERRLVVEVQLVHDVASLLSTTALLRDVRA
jgi:hypothetical protein